jgi:hypothetical protein
MHGSWRLSVDTYRELGPPLTSELASPAVFSFSLPIIGISVTLSDMVWSDNFMPPQTAF